MVASVGMGALFVYCDPKMLPYVATEFAVHGASLAVDPEKNPKTGIGLGIANIVLSAMNTVWAASIMTSAVPLTIYFAAQATKGFITAGYQIWSAQKALKKTE